MAQASMIGRMFSNATVTGRTVRRKNKQGHASAYTYTLKCQCGNVFSMADKALKRASEPCANCRATRFPPQQKRSLRYHELYSTWVNMHNRCANPRCPDYARYGGRGITVCPEWTAATPTSAKSDAGFLQFVKDMGERPAGTTLDREDNDAGYSPDNCRWATPRQQNQNTNSVVWVTIGGYRHTFSEWVDRIGLDKMFALKRLRAAGWDHRGVLLSLLGELGE